MPVCHRRRRYLWRKAWKKQRQSLASLELTRKKLTKAEHVWSQCVRVSIIIHVRAEIPKTLEEIKIESEIGSSLRKLDDSAIIL